MSTTKRKGNRFKRSWTKALVLRAISRWEKRFGQPPLMVDFNPARCRYLAEGNRVRMQRWLDAIAEYETGHYPSSNTVTDLFGSWNNAIKEAGYIPLPAHKPSSEQRTLWVGATNNKDSEDNAAVLDFQWEQVQRAMKKGGRELQEALYDLASVAASWSEELRRENNGT